MPHIYAKSIEECVELPFLDGEFCIHDSFSNDRLTIYFVSQDRIDFALTQRIKNSQILIKYDKQSRPPKTSTLSKAITNLSNRLKAEVVTSNLKIVEKSDETQNEKILKPDFFSKNGEFLKGKNGELEIGFGSGRHILAIAKESPETVFFGVEIYKPSIIQLLQRAKDENIENIFVVDFDARLFLQTLPSSSLNKIHIHFPVPWNDAPHRRVFGQKLVQEAFRVLKNGGSLELRSDDEIYFRDACDVVLEHEKAEFKVFKNRDILVSSKYEDRWKKHGKDIYDLVIKPSKQDSQKEQFCDFEFEKPITKESLETIKLREAIIKDGIVIKFEDFLESRSGSFVVKIVFGNVDMPENKYIYTKEGKSSFYPTKPLLIDDNIKAFRILEEIVAWKK